MALRRSTRRLVGWCCWALPVDISFCSVRKTSAASFIRICIGERMERHIKLPVLVMTSTPCHELLLFTHLSWECRPEAVFAQSQKLRLMGAKCVAAPRLQQTCLSVLQVEDRIGQRCRVGTWMGDQLPQMFTCRQLIQFSEPREASLSFALSR